MVIGVHIQDAITAQESMAVRALLRDAFEVRPGVGHAFAHLYDQVQMTSVHSRVAVFDGRVIGHALLALRAFDLAGISLLGGIVAMVVVDEAFRGQGVGRALIQDLETLAKQEGCVLLHVAGAPTFYTRLGFVPAYIEAWGEMEIPLVFSHKETLREATAQDVALLSHLSLADRAFGSVVADKARWQWVMDTQHPKAMLKYNDHLLGISCKGDACFILDDVGFVRVGWAENKMIVYEAGCVNEAAATRLLNACLAWGYEHGHRHLGAYLSPRNRLLVALSQRGADVKIQEDHELHAKVLDMPYLLQALSDVFCVRLQTCGIKGRLGLSVGAQHFELRLDAEVVVKHVNVIGAVNWHIGLSEAALTRAVLGVDLLHDPENDPALERVLAHLFPLCGPFFWLADSL